MMTMTTSNSSNVKPSAGDRLWPENVRCLKVLLREWIAAQRAGRRIRRTAQSPRPTHSDIQICGSGTGEGSGVDAICWPEANVLVQNSPVADESAALTKSKAKGESRIACA